MMTVALSLNPAIGLPEAVTLGMVFVLVGAWLAWRSAPGVSPGLRSGFFLLRVAGLAALALAWLNPGRWVEPPQDTHRAWLVLLDRSASMKADAGDGGSRWVAAVRAAEKLRHAPAGAGPVHVRTFASQLEDETTAPDALAPDGAGTDLAQAAGTALDQRALPLAGLVVISDGRATSRSNLEEVGRRAMGRGVPIQTVAIGAGSPLKDLDLVALPRQVTSYKGQPVKVSALVENRGLGPIRPTVQLLDAAGRELGRKEVELKDGVRLPVTFEVPTVPDAGAEYTLRTAPWPGEQVPANNTDVVRVNVLSSRTRVLLLEGAPYWDSKFLAQLLRHQSAIDILTVHRLNEERYFRVEEKGAEPLQSPDSVFPPTAAELGRYDLIVFGKGADGFLDSARIAALQGFVRDQGGTVLFARGKPYSGQFPALESLEPVDWGEDTGAVAHFTPLALADSSAGLFGAALPAANDRVWASLPPLADVRNIARLKPFTRVLAEGAMEGRQARVPLLVARRYGRGMVAAVNADGLWRWDFRPEVQARGAIYQHFWVQLMQWCATYSEFRPGEDYAVRLAEAVAEPGQSVRATIIWRGPVMPEPHPVLKIARAGQPPADAIATPIPAPEGGLAWAAVVPGGEPGRYEAHVADPALKGTPWQGEARLTVLAPPAESDDLRPDPESLDLLARGSGGKLWKPAELDGLLAQMGRHDSAAERGKPAWEPLWATWWAALAMSACFGAEWWLRRREGLL